MSEAPAPSLALVVAMASNRCIGKDNALPWHLPEDLKHFRRVTMGHAIIMGRRTHLSIGKPLKGRHNIVLTRGGDQFDGCTMAQSLDQALEIAYAAGDDFPRIVGGTTVYEAALPRCTRMYITEVHREVDGDAFFPEYAPTHWQESSRQQGADGLCSFVQLDRAGTVPPTDQEQTQ